MKAKQTSLMGITSQPAADRSSATGKYYYTIIAGRSVRMPILSFEPFCINCSAAEPYNEPPLTGDIDYTAIHRHNRRRKAAIEEIASDPYLLLGNRHITIELIDAVMRRYNVSRANARVMIHKARMLVKEI